MSSVNSSDISLPAEVLNHLPAEVLNHLPAEVLNHLPAEVLTPFKHPKLSAKFNLLASFICFLSTLSPNNNLLPITFISPFNLHSLISILQDFDNHFALHSCSLKILSRKEEKQKNKKAPSTKNNKSNDNNTKLNEHSDLIATLVALANSSDSVDINAKPNTTLPVENISSPIANVKQASTNAPEKAKRKYTRKPKVTAISSEITNSVSA